MDTTYNLNGGFKPTLKRFADLEGPDFFPTPGWATYALIDNERFSGDIWECACGDGAMSVVLENTDQPVSSSDLYDRGYGDSGIDFLAPDRRAKNIVTNPPYMGNAGMNSVLRAFAKTFFPNERSDLFACFIERSFSWLGKNAFTSMVTTGQQITEKTALVIEDDKVVSQLIRLYLAQAGYRVLEAQDGIDGLRMALEESPDIVLLDLNLPGMDGIEVCKNVRKESEVPIIMVTARVEESDRLTGLDLGADDYVSKPFSPRELVARVNAVLRRTQHDSKKREETGNHLIAGDVDVDLDRRSATVLGVEIELTPTEFRLLAYFIEGHGRTVSRDQIIENVFGYDFSGYDRTVDTHVSNLRKKLEAANPDRKQLKTMYGIGYRFDV